eukprot:6252224-Amphidinium_carterae.1
MHLCGPIAACMCVRWPNCVRLKLYHTSVGDDALDGLKDWVASVLAQMEWTSLRMCSVGMCMGPTYMRENLEVRPRACPRTSFVSSLWTSDIACCTTAAEARPLVSVCKKLLHCKDKAPLCGGQLEVVATRFSIQIRVSCVTVIDGHSCKCHRKCPTHPAHCVHIVLTCIEGSCTLIGRQIHNGGKYPYRCGSWGRSALWLRLEHNDITNPGTVAVRACCCELVVLPNQRIANLSIC